MSRCNEERPVQNRNWGTQSESGSGKENEKKIRSSLVLRPGCLKRRSIWSLTYQVWLQATRRSTGKHSKQRAQACPSEESPTALTLVYASQNPSSCIGDGNKLPGRSSHHVLSMEIVVILQGGFAEAYE